MACKQCKKKDIKSMFIANSIVMLVGAIYAGVGILANSIPMTMFGCLIIYLADNFMHKLRSYK